VESEIASGHGAAQLGLRADDDADHYEWLIASPSSPITPSNFTVTLDISRIISEIYGDFHRKTQIFLVQCFNASVVDLTSEHCNGGWA